MQHASEPYFEHHPEHNLLNLIYTEFSFILAVYLFQLIIVEEVFQRHIHLVCYNYDKAVACFMYSKSHT